MSGSLYLAWRYLLFHRFKTAILVGSVTMILFVPAGLRVLVRQSETRLAARAEATPLLIGAPGSPLELALNSLYFSSEVPEQLQFSESQRIRETGLAQSIPLYIRFHSRNTPIVGTSLDYFEFRNLQLNAGRPLGRLGDCVLGADVAHEHGLGPGDSVVSSPENVFDLAGVYPLKMRVTGVLAPNDTPDDEAIFVDVKTAWVIEGLAHGHEDLAAPEATDGVLKRDGNRITANASVQQFNEITDENIQSFHFHGATDTFPITAVLAVPPDEKSETLLLGRYLSNEQNYQALQPRKVIGQLLATILTVEQYVLAALFTVGSATVATLTLVFLLSLRLRQREIETMIKIGGSRIRIAGVWVAEILLVIVGAALMAGLLTWMTYSFGERIIRAFIG